MAQDDDWTVVGASGKARPGRKPRQQPAAGCAHAPHQPTKAAAPASSNPATLPGWDQQGGLLNANAVSRSRKAHRHKQQVPKTLEEQVAALARLVADCRAEVARSQFYDHLKQAFASTACHDLSLTPCSSSAYDMQSDSSMDSKAAAAQQLHHTSQASGQLGPMQLIQTCPVTSMLPLKQCSVSHVLPQEQCSVDKTAQQPSSGAQGVPHAPGGAEQAAKGNSGSPYRAVGRTEAQGCTQQRGTCQEQTAASSWALSIQQLVCYGLGSIQDSRNARYQLGLLLLLQQELLPGLASPPEVYDPQFNEVDITLLTQLGLHVLTQNEQCARRALQPTFFYLPHVEGHMCDNLLAANLAQADTQQCTTGCTLSMTVLLGNSFSTYQDRWEVGQMRPTAAAVQKNSACASASDGRPQRPDTMLKLLAAGHVKEVSVIQEPSFPAPSAFNDTSLHLFTCPHNYS